jgi:hypothetical protein
MVIPNGNFCGALLEIKAIPLSSVAVACPTDTGVRIPVASIVMSAGAVIDGGV